MKLQLRLFLVFILVGVGSIILTGLLTSVIALSFVPEEDEEDFPAGTEPYQPDPETVETVNTGESLGDFVNLAVLTAGVSVAVFASISSWLISRHITKPISQIMDATEDIAAGNYNRQVERVQDDEIGILVSHFNKMAQELSKIEQTRQQLIADVSHELRTPLTSIKGMVESFEDRVIDDTPENYQLIYQQIDRLQRLVNDMETLSFTNSSALILNWESFQPDELATDIVAIMRPQYEAKGVALTCHVVQPVSDLVADRERLEQVLINLLSNSLAYTSTSGHVSLRVLQKGTIVRLEVADDGIGIDPENLSLIFQRFARVDKSRARSTGGSGIGLTIAKQIVEAHQGRIWAESAGLNQGTTVKVDIPLLALSVA